MNSNMTSGGFEQFCGGPFWNLSLLLDNTWPELTPCFMSTVLVWVPCGYVWLLLPYFLYDVNNEHSTNNLSPSNSGPKLRSRDGHHRLFTHNDDAIGGPVIGSGESPPGVLSMLCIVKMMVTSLMAVLSLVQLVFDAQSQQPAAQILARAIYLATYGILVVELWYERHKARNPMFISFYFYFMNVIFGLIPLYTWILSGNYEQHSAEFSVFVIILVLNSLCFVLTFVPDNIWGRGRRGYQNIEGNPCPEAIAPYPIQLLFLWMLRLMLTGFKREITPDDLWEMNPRDQGRRVNPRFEKYWEEEVERTRRINSVHFSELFYDSSAPVTSQERSPYTDRKATKHGHFHKKKSLAVSAQYKGADERTSLVMAPESKCSGAETANSDVQLKTPSLLRVIARLIWGDMLVTLIQKVLADVSLFTGPMILSALIVRLQFPDEDKIWQAYVLSFGLLVTGVLKSLLFAHSMYRSAVIGIRLKTVLVAAIYKKALTISSSAKKGSTVGEIVNLMSVDCQRLQEIMNFIFFMWTTPLQIAIGVVLLYIVIGPSVLSGLVLLVITIPINSWMGSQQKRIQEALLKMKDTRIKVVNEILNGMKVLKLYAWEDRFKHKVEGIREKEIKELYKIALLYVLSGMVWGLAPFLVGLVTFTTYVMIDENNVLDPQKAFVSLALFNLLRTPMNFVSTIIVYTVQVNVSIKRINKFLITEDLNLNNTHWDTHAENAVNIRDGTFTWDNYLRPNLRKINVTIPEGHLTAIVGPVGCGKTSLICAMLGEMEKLQGSVTCKGKVAYVSQQAWIQNATVRDNIIFSKKYNKQRYMQVIRACELERDFEILEAGDQTEIGEKGINLSGGQKQRVNLARAVYSDSDIYLFDDPLSAVDAHVGKAIFKKVMGNEGLLSAKTRVLVTHGVHWLPLVDDIIVLSNGKISEQGSYEQLVSRNGPFAQFLQIYLMSSPATEEHYDNEILSDDDEEIRAVKEEMRSRVDLVTSDTATSCDEFQYFTKKERPRKRRKNRRLESSLSQAMVIHESLDLSMTLTSSVKSNHPVAGKLIVEEKLETGKVKRDVFVTYGRAAGLCAICSAFLSYALNQAFLVGSSFFLTVWTEDPVLLNATTRVEPEGRRMLDFYLLVYGGVFGIAQLVTFVSFNILFWYRMVHAAKELHHMLLDRLFHAPMFFFDQTPIGRILNRFSKDVDTVDNNLPLILRDWLVAGSMIFVTIIVVLIQTPIFGAVLIPLCILFYIIQNYYVRTSRQLKRIESITRSPIYAHFSESITGAAVIRAYGATNRFIQESQKRVDKNQVYYFASQAAIRWLQLNMDILANLVVLFAAIFQITGGGGGSDAGLSVSYALQISGSLTYMVRQICEFETNIVSVERMKEYSLVEQEAALVNPQNRPPKSWPPKGDVTFSGYQTRYREGLDLVLKGIDCKIHGGEKIGIVGRTGAGKSSLTLCLFRIIEAVEGSITIDGINIADLGLHDLRSKLTILPQDPVLFSGSLRMNVDPFDQYTDAQLWTALERSHLKEFVAGQPDKLMYECGEEGANLSIGQRQLVCLARSLLRHTKILILDEATAAIDMETDALIQKTIRDAFQDCTILAIAHRLNTIMDYDRIIVMDAGLISEFDSPRNLINARGIFYGMCKEAGLA